MQIIKTCEQGSEEWHKGRMGKITSTKLKDVMGSPMARYKLMSNLIAEEGTGKSDRIKATVEMERGTTEEPFALERFREMTGKALMDVAFCVSTENPFWINSPDSLVVPDGDVIEEAVEIKSLKSGNHTFYDILNTFEDINAKMPAGKRVYFGVPSEYTWQVVDYFVVNPDLKTLYFLYWDARFLDEEKQLKIIEVKSTDPELQIKIAEAKAALIEFEKEYLMIKNVLLNNNF